MRIQRGHVPLWMRIQAWQVPRFGAQRERTHAFFQIKPLVFLKSSERRRFESGGALFLFLYYRNIH